MQTRKFTRYPTDSLISFVINGIIGEHQHYLKDSSPGGLCIKSLGCIKPKTQLNIRVSSSDDTNYIRGKIKWCLPLDNAQYLLGVEFEDLILQSDIINELQSEILRLDENPESSPV